MVLREQMGFYDRYVLPPLINLACASKPNMKQREKIVPRAEGDVLEIGVGSGLNLAYYDTSKVRKLWGLEPSEGMRKLARKKLGDSELNVEWIDLPGEEDPARRQQRRHRAGDVYAVHDPGRAPRPSGHAACSAAGG